MKAFKSYSLYFVYCNFFSNQEILSAIEKNMKKCIIEYYNYFVKVYTNISKSNSLPYD